MIYFRVQRIDGWCESSRINHEIQNQNSRPVDGIKCKYDYLNLGGTAHKASLQLLQRRFFYFLDLDNYRRKIYEHY